MTHLKRFFQWLAAEPGYRSRLKYTDAEYFNITEKEMRVAMAGRECPYLSVAQILHAIGASRPPQSLNAATAR